MTISIVTPSLNQGRFIGEAIESVTNQVGSFEEIEHIVVDGGSTDTTAEVLARFPHLRILEDSGLGQSRAVNIGLRAATGDVIGWLNADDRYVSGAFRGVKRALDEHRESGILYGNARFIDEVGEVTGEVRPGPFDLARMLHGLNPIAQPAVFVRADLLRVIGLVDEELDYAMDYELWLRAAEVTSLAWVDQTWADFRMHPDSKTVSRTPAFWPESRAIARAYGGPFFSTSWRERTLNRHYPAVLLHSFLRGNFLRGAKIERRMRTTVRVRVNRRG